MAEYSPMIKKYLLTKQQYEDCILLYRLGDFYEMFFEDAQKASRILDLVLTKRSCGDNQYAPMCGVPYHAVDAYIGKLINAGEKVAICEQLTEPIKGVEVQRGVVKVITPGTVMESDILEEKRNNYIACVISNDAVAGCAFCDLSTGQFFAAELDEVSLIKDLQELLVSYKPSEILGNNKAYELNNSLECVRADYVSVITLNEQCLQMEYAKAKHIVEQHYAVDTLDGFGLRGKKTAITACGALLQYLQDTQMRDLPHLNPIKVIVKNEFMSIDIKTRRNLELTVSANDNKRKGSLLWLLDKTCTSMGARQLVGWIDRPLQSVQKINARLDGTEELYRNFVLRDKLVELLSGVKDIERLAGRIAYNSVTPKDCNALQASLVYLPQIKTLLEGTRTKILQRLGTEIDSLDDVCKLLASAIVKEAPQVIKDGGFIKKGYNSELDELIDISTNSKQLIANLEQKERTRTGIKTLKLGYNRVFGYYFEISNSLKDLAPSDYIRKQTLTNGERFVTQELKELEEKILTADERRIKLEKQLFEELRIKLLQYIPAMQHTSYCIATIDCLLSFSRVAVDKNYVRPTINTKDSTLKIREGRHPVVEAYLSRNAFISNDTLLDTTDNRTMIITGPNMAGKSTYMRQVALITLLAHIGCFVPAEEALVPIVDRIFTRVGASDDLTFNQSTFMVEMAEVANIVNNATSNSLIVLDEVGRGTSTFDGLSIAWAIMEYVSEKIRAKTLFATHYHELTELEGRVEGVKNYKIAVKELPNGIVFLHKITRGGANKSFGIEVASLAGVPKSICDRAREIVKMLENSDINYKIEDIETTQKHKEIARTANEVVSVLKDLDINRCSPIEAFGILSDLVNKVK